MLKEIKEAKGKVHSMGANPWWWVPVLTSPYVSTIAVYSVLLTGISGQRQYVII